MAHTVAAGDPAGILLLDGPTATAANDAFLAALKPPCIVPVGDFPGDPAKLGKRLGERAQRPRTWTQAHRAICTEQIVPRRPRRWSFLPGRAAPLLLHSACLAGTLKAPLYVTHRPHFERHAS